MAAVDEATGPSDSIAVLRAALERRYDIRRPLGQGAFATVYLAVDVRHGREVAIKVLNVDPGSEEPERRFLREIRVLAAAAMRPVARRTPTPTAERLDGA